MPTKLLEYWGICCRVIQIFRCNRPQVLNYNENVYLTSYVSLTYRTPSVFVYQDAVTAGDNGPLENVSCHNTDEFCTLSLDNLM